MAWKNRHVPKDPDFIVKCSYCDRPARLVWGKDIWKAAHLAHKRYWECRVCDARVGCHPGTTYPLGRLANRKLRKAKSAVHAAFDPIWRSQRFTRSEAYEWLADQLGISKANCHIGMFDLETCERALEVLNQFAESRHALEKHQQKGN
jgi:hypothetical protein